LFSFRNSLYIKAVKKTEPGAGKMKRIHAFLLVTFAIIFGLLDATTVCAADIVRGPYLQNATPNGVTIKWRTDVNETSKVWYGTYMDG